LDDVDINGKGTEAKKSRNRDGMVFQYPEHQIFAETFSRMGIRTSNKGLSEEEVEKK
jgi:energy-coupling factor transport system ATP-binding protein